MKFLRLVRSASLLMLLSWAAAPLVAQSTSHSLVHNLKITILSTMLSDRAVGEWGFAALVEADGHRILVDTGAKPDTVISNLRTLHLDLSDVREVVLTHNHDDHVGGLLTLRREFMKSNPAALSLVHVGKGIFFSRPDGRAEGNPMLLLKKQYEDTGGKFVEHDTATELFPGAWLSGPVPRPYPERNWSNLGKVQTPSALVEDTVPEDQSLVFNTANGLVVVSGCGHAGVVNTITFAETAFPKTPVYALIGGFHLFSATDQQLDWTADKLKGFGVSYLIGAHCTGIESVYRIREKLNLSRHSAVVGAVGASFVLGEGIHPGLIAQ